MQNAPQEYSRLRWSRLNGAAVAALVTGEEGLQILSKRGHLKRAKWTPFFLAGNRTFFHAVWGGRVGELFDHVHVNGAGEETDSSSVDIPIPGYSKV